MAETIMIDEKELVKELQGMRDEGYLSDALLRRAVRRLSESDDRFDWVGVYLLDDGGEELWLHNYLGGHTRQAKIPVGEGIPGRAVSEKENRIVGDVSEFEEPLSSSPRMTSELVVLIRAGDQIFGEIDVYGKDADAFGEGDENALQAIADKLAEQIMAERR
ncbi:MAG: GAF domain-containing protein [Gemmatimonadota bacterium]